MINATVNGARPAGSSSVPWSVAPGTTTCIASVDAGVNGAALLATEGVDVEFTADGIDELAKSAFQANEQLENIGARRLHTVMEKVLEDLSYDAGDTHKGNFRITADYVRGQLADVLKSQDLSKFIL